MPAFVDGTQHRLSDGAVQSYRLLNLDDLVVASMKDTFAALIAIPVPN
jgi:hypothetical protein